MGADVEDVCDVCHVNKENLMRSALPEKGRSLVYRITVDEVLDDSLVRLLIAPLAAGVEDLTADDLDCWKNERSVLATRDDILDRLGLRGHGALVARVVKDVAGPKKRKEPLDDLFWRTLSEGQVYLFGKFRVTRSRHKPGAIRVGGGQKDLLRIDRLSSVKGNAKKLYAAALAGGTGNGR